MTFVGWRANLNESSSPDEDCRWGVDGGRGVGRRSTDDRAVNLTSIMG